jgi:hypothetical protein
MGRLAQLAKAKGWRRWREYVGECQRQEELDQSTSAARAKNDELVHQMKLSLQLRIEHRSLSLGFRRWSAHALGSYQQALATSHSRNHASLLRIAACGLADCAMRLDLIRAWELWVECAASTIKMYSTRPSLQQWEQEQEQEHRERHQREQWQRRWDQREHEHQQEKWQWQREQEQREDWDQQRQWEQQQQREQQQQWKQNQQQRMNTNEAHGQRRRQREMCEAWVRWVEWCEEDYAVEQEYYANQAVMEQEQLFVAWEKWLEWCASDASEQHRRCCALSKLQDHRGVKMIRM